MINKKLINFYNLNSLQEFFMKFYCTCRLCRMSSMSKMYRRRSSSRLATRKKRSVISVTLRPALRTLAIVGVFFVCTGPTFITSLIYWVRFMFQRLFVISIVTLSLNFLQNKVCTSNTILNDSRPNSILIPLRISTTRITLKCRSKFLGWCTGWCFWTVLLTLSFSDLWTEISRGSMWTHCAFPASKSGASCASNTKELGIAIVGSVREF